MKFFNLHVPKGTVNGGCEMPTQNGSIVSAKQCQDDWLSSVVLSYIHSVISSSCVQCPLVKIYYYGCIFVHISPIFLTKQNEMYNIQWSKCLLSISFSFLFFLSIFLWFLIPFLLFMHSLYVKSFLSSFRLLNYRNVFK
jgi:hypothetical protein